MADGFLHSLETMGLQDGPGIRTVFFLQGCPLRCLYCHNPDSQPCRGGERITADEIVARAKRYRSYYGREGGVTFSGGEPLLQGAFLAEVLPRLGEEGIHRCVDTSGVGDPAYYAALLPEIDLLLLDVKALDPTTYRRLTGAPTAAYRRFVEALLDPAMGFRGRIWIRHVMIPGVSDSEEAMASLLEEIEPLRHVIDRIEILPYHVMARDKYTALGKAYPMGDTPAMDPGRARELQDWAMQHLMGTDTSAPQQAPNAQAGDAAGEQMATPS